MTTDKDDYAPGENATLLIESPFQTARALVVTEQPGGHFDYAWVDMANGVGRYTLAVRKDQMPQLPVHVLLMRGRLAGPPPSADRAVRPGQADDAGRDDMGQGAAGAEQGDRRVRGARRRRGRRRPSR